MRNGDNPLFPLPSFIMGLFWMFNFQLSDSHNCPLLYCNISLINYILETFALIISKNTLLYPYIFLSKCMFLRLPRVFEMLQ